MEFNDRYHRFRYIRTNENNRITTKVYDEDMELIGVINEE
jgi:hypothetical protein